MSRPCEKVLTLIIYLRHKGTVSVIGGSSDKIAAGVIFNVNPPNPAKIICDKTEYPTNIPSYC